MTLRQQLIRFTLVLSSVIILYGCGTKEEYKEFFEVLFSPPQAGERPHTDVSGDSQSQSNIDDIFARLDSHFYFEAPPDVSNPIGSWDKARGAKLKAIPGVSYEVAQPYTVSNGKIHSAYRGHSENGRLWVWISLKKNGSGTNVEYRISGASNLSRAAEVMEEWIKESV